MQDRFKFRGIHPVLNELQEIKFIDFIHNTVDFGDGDIFNIEDVKIQQCIGLKDENGTLIYEDDLVQILGDEIPYVIEFEQDRAMFVIHSKIDRVCCNFDNYSGDDLYVIGNIYENLELLEDKR